MLARTNGMLSDTINRLIISCWCLFILGMDARNAPAAPPTYCVVNLGSTEKSDHYEVSFDDQLPKDFSTNSNAYKSVKILLKWIEPKPFRMGQKHVALPAHTVTLSQGFYLAVYETTQAQWQQVMQLQPFHFTNQPYSPAEKISWKDIRGEEKRHNWPQSREVAAESFIGLLRQRTGAVHNFDLPTEAQWEFACRAGSTKQWSYGDSEELAEEYSWTENNSGKSTHDVGLKKPNNFGLYDMHGNVWEWCLDRYGAYSHEDLTDPVGPDSGWYRVWRGGDFGSSDYLSQSAHRSGSAPVSRAINAGFRLAIQPAD